MKFKQQNNESELYKGLIDLIQSGIKIATLAYAAKNYFVDNSTTEYATFFNRIYTVYIACKDELTNLLREELQEIPELIIPKVVTEFENTLEPFEILAKMEDDYIEQFNNVITLAQSEKNWKIFYLLLIRVNIFNHVGCKAFIAAKENKPLPCV